MRKLAIFAFALGVCLSQGAFAHRHHEVIVVPEYVAVEMEPPAEIVEEQGNCPGAGYMWVKGHWCWENRWRWTRGTWVVKPHETAVWTAGYWKSKHNHWVWTPGYWS